MTRGRNHDTLEALRKRRDAWAREIGTSSEYAAMAPQVVADLDAEIASLTRSDTKGEGDAD